MSSELANQDDLLNMVANFGGVFGITNGIRLIVGSLVMKARKFGRAKEIGDLRRLNIFLRYQQITV